MTGNNNTPLVEEQRIIEQTEQEIIQELREQIKVLQDENRELKKNDKKFRILSLFRKKQSSKLGKDLEAKKRHANKMHDLAVEYFQTLKDDNKETELTEVLKKRGEIKNLKQELTQKKQEIINLKTTVADLQSQVNQNKDLINPLIAFSTSLLNKPLTYFTVDDGCLNEAKASNLYQSNNSVKVTVDELLKLGFPNNFVDHPNVKKIMGASTIKIDFSVSSYSVKGSQLWGEKDPQAHIVKYFADEKTIIEINGIRDRVDVFDILNNLPIRGTKLVSINISWLTGSSHMVGIEPNLHKKDCSPDSRVIRFLNDWNPDFSQCKELRNFSYVGNASLNHKTFNFRGTKITSSTFHSGGSNCSVSAWGNN